MSILDFASTKANWLTINAFNHCHRLPETQTHLREIYFQGGAVDFGKFDHWEGDNKPVWKFGRSDTREVVATCHFGRELRSIQEEVPAFTDEPLDLNDEIDNNSSPEDLDLLGDRGSIIVSYPSNTRSELLKDLRPLGRSRTRGGNNHWVTIQGRIGEGDDPLPPNVPVDQPVVKGGGYVGVREFIQKILRINREDGDAIMATPFSAFPGDFWMDSNIPKMTVVFKSIADPNLLNLVIGHRAAAPPSGTTKEMIIALKSEDEPLEIAFKLQEANMQLRNDKGGAPFLGYYLQSNVFCALGTERNQGAANLVPRNLGGLMTHYIGGIPDLLPTSDITSILKKLGFHDDEVENPNNRVLQIGKGSTIVVEIRTRRQMQIAPARYRNVRISEEEPPSERELLITKATPLFLAKPEDKEEPATDQRADYTLPYHSRAAYAKLARIRGLNPNPESKNNTTSTNNSINSSKNGDNKTQCSTSNQTNNKGSNNSRKGQNSNPSMDGSSSRGRKDSGEASKDNNNANDRRRASKDSRGGNRSDSRPGDKENRHKSRFLDCESSSGEESGEGRKAADYGEGMATPYHNHYNVLSIDDSDEETEERGERKENTGGGKRKRGSRESKNKMQLQEVEKRKEKRVKEKARGKKETERLKKKEDKEAKEREERNRIREGKKREEEKREAGRKKGKKEKAQTKKREKRKRQSKRRKEEEDMREEKEGRTKDKEHQDVEEEIDIGGGADDGLVAIRREVDKRGGRTFTTQWSASEGEGEGSSGGDDDVEEAGGGSEMREGGDSDSEAEDEVRHDEREGEDEKEEEREDEEDEEKEEDENENNEEGDSESEQSKEDEDIFAEENDDDIQDNESADEQQDGSEEENEEESDRNKRSEHESDDSDHNDDDDEPTSRKETIREKDRGESPANARKKNRSRSRSPRESLSEEMPDSDHEDRDDKQQKSKRKKGKEVTDNARPEQRSIKRFFTPNKPMNDNEPQPNPKRNYNPQKSNEPNQDDEEIQTKKKKKERRETNQVKSRPQTNEEDEEMSNENKQNYNEVKENEERRKGKNPHPTKPRPKPSQQNAKTMMTPPKTRSKTLGKKKGGKGNKNNEAQ